MYDLHDEDDPVNMLDSHLIDSNGLLNERLQHLMKRVNATGESNKILNSRLISVERERDALARLIGMERQKALDMSKVVESVRYQMADKDLELQK